MSTILVVEDHEDTRVLLMEGLRLEGWKALGAATVSGALALVRSAPIDLVVSDVHLGSGDGAAVQATLRVDPALAEIPFLFITGTRPTVSACSLTGCSLNPFTWTTCSPPSATPCRCARTRRMPKRR